MSTGIWLVLRTWSRQFPSEILSEPRRIVCHCSLGRERGTLLVDPCHCAVKLIISHGTDVGSFSPCLSASQHSPPPPHTHTSRPPFNSCQTRLRFCKTLTERVFLTPHVRNETPSCFLAFQFQWLPGWSPCCVLLKHCWAWGHCLLLFVAAGVNETSAQVVYFSKDHSDAIMEKNVLNYSRVSYGNIIKNCICLWLC